MSGVGYGDIRPFNNLEKLFSMGCMMITTGVNAYLIGALSTIFNRSSSIAKEMRLKSLHINQFLIHHSIPSELRARILSYLDFLIEHKRTNKLNENEVLDLLNENLREQVIANLNGRILNECELFSQFDMIFISEITFLLERKLFVMSDTVFEEGDPGNKMYFIGKGSVVLLHIKTGTYIKQLKENQSFGQVSFFSKFKRGCSVRSNTFTEMLVLRFSEFKKSMMNFKEDERRYQEMCRELFLIITHR